MIIFLHGAMGLHTWASYMTMHAKMMAMAKSEESPPLQRQQLEMEHGTQ